MAVTPTNASEAHRGVGRPRSASADAAILEATRSLLAEQGWSGLSVEAVAARAGVAKSTVYRRWSSRADLAIGAVAELLAGAHTEPGTSAEDDIRRSLRAHAQVLARPESRAAYLAVIAEAARDDALRARFDEEILDRGRRLIADGMERAEARGELPPGLDVNLVHDLLAGPMVHRVLVRGGEADEAFLDCLAQLMLAGSSVLGPAGEPAGDDRPTPR
jgi:AcrR family transcriptional regulator